MIIRHYFAFDRSITGKLNGKSLDALNWDALRTSGIDDVFSLENSRSEYEKNCAANVSYVETAKKLVNMFRINDISEIVSLGCGKGILEWNIKQTAPDIKVIATDYAKQSVEALRVLFPLCDGMEQFDMLNDSYHDLFDKFHLDSSACLLMYRVSTEFSFDEWRRVFEKLRREQVQRIIWIPTEILNLKLAFQAKKMQLKNLVLMRRQMFCGWMYGDEELKKMWDGLYDITSFKTLNETGLYFLRRTE